MPRSHRSPPERNEEPSIAAAGTYETAARRPRHPIGGRGAASRCDDGRAGAGRARGWSAYAGPRQVYPSRRGQAPSRIVRTASA